MPRRRAFVCWVPAIGGDPEAMCGIFMATSASKARYKCFLNYSDAYEDAVITEIMVRRAAAYDHLAFKEGVMPEFIEGSPVHSASPGAYR